MITTLMGLAVLAAVVAVGLRKLQQRAADRALPGRSPATAIPIENYAEIDIAVRMQTCRCGGRYTLRGEGPVRNGEHPLRVANLECRRCERERKVYFDLSTIRH